ncbi:CAP domain-containing protein [Kitasatospora sp. NPDC091276]|uniref:CAP domain-containing protein n=1 Tax=unclassified Kitasatospora TaxID=2633591 RepID=UPI00341B6E13
MTKRFRVAAALVLAGTTLVIASPAQAALQPSVNTKPSPLEFSGVGHYTQVMWAKSYKVGCAYMKYAAHGMDYVVLACNYAPSGNPVPTDVAILPS